MMNKTSQPGGTATYRESQRFTQSWLLLIIAATTALLLWAMFSQFVLDKPWGSNPAPDWLLAILGVVIGIGLPIWFFFLKLVVEVRPDGLWYKFVGLHRRWHHFQWSQVEHFYARDYKPIREYGGWGIRCGFSGRAYNVKGKQGLQLVLHGGEKVLFGSQNPERLVSANAAQCRRLACARQMPTSADWLA
jgi:hypothetical protein